MRWMSISASPGTKRQHTVGLIAFLVVAAAQAAASGAGHDTGNRGGDCDGSPVLIGVNAQGRFCDGIPRLERRSPLGTATLEIAPVAADAGRCMADLSIVSHGIRSRLWRQEAREFLISDVDRVILIAGPDAEGPPPVVRVLDFTGAELWHATAPGLSDPRLSPDGASLAYRTPESLVQLDLRTLRAHSYPRGYLFALGPAGLLAGLAAAPSVDPVGSTDEGSWDLFIGRDGQVLDTYHLRALTPLRMVFSPDAQAVYILDRETLQCVSRRDGARTQLLSAPLGARLRDLRVHGDALAVGIRHERGDGWAGEIALISPAGVVLSRQWGTEDGRACGSASRAAAASGSAEDAGSRILPWPFTPAQGHPIGNTYGEYQNYGGAGYLHPGIDLFGAPGQAVHAVHAGQVKAVLTTGGDWYWRVATADTVTSGYSTGYLYAHLEQQSIAVDVGDMVTAGQYLGELVEWPIYDFTHCHFARIRDVGMQWYGSWLTPDNPHLDFTGHADPDPPIFESAHGSDWLAFCTNQTSTYLNPMALHGEVDIIAHVSDPIGTPWNCSVREIRYSIYPTGHPSLPVVDDKLAVYFDMWSDMYAGGSHDPFLVELLYKRDGVCQTQGDYDYREFYHIITNSDGNQVYENSDLWEAWDTSLVPDTEYIVEVTAWDVAGNSATVSMPVRVSNGGTASVAAGEGPWLAPIRWQAGLPGAAVEIAFQTARAGYVDLSVHDVLGRRIAHVVDGELAAGSHAVTWNGRDAAGHSVAPGAYFLHLITPSGKGSRKIAVVR
jgi:murein DD-endopeptidase MepM/ murein hydrolase activator NlpD